MAIALDLVVALADHVNHVIGRVVANSLCAPNAPGALQLAYIGAIAGVIDGDVVGEVSAHQELMAAWLGQGSGSCRAKQQGDEHLE